MAAKKKIKKSKNIKSKSGAKPKSPKTVLTRKKGVAEREHGPASWLLPTVEGTYTKLMPRDAQDKPAAGSKAQSG